MVVEQVLRILPLQEKSMVLQLLLLLLKAGTWSIAEKSLEESMISQDDRLHDMIQIKYC